MVLAVVDIFSVFNGGGIGPYQSSIAVIVVAILLALCCAAPLKIARLEFVRWLGLACIASGTVLGVYLIWTANLFAYELISQAYWALIILSLALAQTCLLLRMGGSGQSLAIVVKTTLTITAVVALSSLYSIAVSGMAPGSYTSSVINYLVIVDIIGTLAALGLNATHRKLKRR